MDYYPRPETPWQAEAKWHDNGLPANMAAILHEQCKRMRYRSYGVRYQ